MPRLCRNPASFLRLRLGLAELLALLAVFLEGEIVLRHPRQFVLDREPGRRKLHSEVLQPVSLALDGAPQFLDPGAILAVGGHELADADVFLLQRAPVEIEGCSLILFSTTITGEFPPKLSISRSQ